MLKIIICEDEEIIRKKISNSLNAISIKHDIELEIPLSTDNPEDVFSFASNNKCDLLLLDIDLNNEKMDGIVLGEKLRKIDSNILIVFLTSRLERMFDVFKVRPFDFIAKPSIMPHLEETILSVVSSKSCTPHGNFTKIKNKIVNLDEVIYIEKQLMKSVFNSRVHNIEIYMSFIDLLSCLTENFIQVSKSFIVNKAFITYVDCKSKDIHLKNGEVIRYSNKYISDSEDFVHG